MPTIKTAKRSFFTEQLEQWGFEFTCKVNMDSKTGELFMEIPNHYADAFITHEINNNAEFKNDFIFKFNKGKAVLNFINKDISTFDRKIDALNHFYYELKANELEKKVIVIDAKLAHNFFHTKSEDDNEEYIQRETIDDFIFRNTSNTVHSKNKFWF